MDQGKGKAVILPLLLLSFCLPSCRVASDESDLSSATESQTKTLAEILPWLNELEYSDLDRIEMRSNPANSGPTLQKFDSVYLSSGTEARTCLDGIKNTVATKAQNGIIDGGEGPKTYYLYKEGGSVCSFQTIQDYLTIDSQSYLLEESPKAPSW